MPLFCHTPFVSHVCGCNPLHFSAVGLHTPVHAPFTHAWFTHAVVFCHTPLVLQNFGVVLFAHWVGVTLGLHTPVHAPATHAWFTHAVVFCHTPLALQN